MITIIRNMKEFPYQGFATTQDFVTLVRNAALRSNSAIILSYHPDEPASYLMMHADVVLDVEFDPAPVTSDPTLAKTEDRISFTIIKCRICGPGPSINLAQLGDFLADVALSHAQAHRYVVENTGKDQFSVIDRSTGLEECVCTPYANEAQRADVRALMIANALNANQE